MRPAGAPGTSQVVEQIKALLAKLVPAQEVQDLTVEGPWVERGLALVKACFVRGYAPFCGRLPMVPARWMVAETARRGGACLQQEHPAPPAGEVRARLSHGMAARLSAAPGCGASRWIFAAAGRLAWIRRARVRESVCKAWPQAEWDVLRVGRGMLDGVARRYGLAPKCGWAPQGRTSC